jgi:outer membrane protein TolC
MRSDSGCFRSSRQGPGISRQKISELTIRTSAAGAGGAREFDLIQTFYDAGLDAFWELDFFGRVRRSVEAFAAD